MRQLHQLTYVKCPPNEARTYLLRFFEDRRQPDRPGPEEPVRLALRAPITLPGLRTEIVLQRDVVATITLASSTNDDLADMAIVWEPAGGGPFPRFTGSLKARNAEDYESFSLVLDGSYVAPLGVGGAAFDAALGHRIAIATARNLLAEVRDSIERAYMASEYQKKAKREESKRATE